MERLTRWNEQTEQAELVEYDTEEWKDFKSTLYDLDEHFVSTAINQLAIYEDTGLEPHQIDAICEQLNALVDEVLEYKTAEEQGLLLRLPFKVGDVAYYLHKVYLVYADKWIYEIDEVEVDSFLLSEKICVNVAYRIGSEVFRKTLTPYKTLFPTREEAEKALAEMGSR